ncbi:MAG: DUF4249 domain-containing protein [Dysgonamonadaceae bacterium]|jgi:hypothetical protein|nr:DUF4249 domain-containing protein [Dysgonamonadaceae bacterium]
MKPFIGLVLLIFLMACTEPFDIKTTDSPPVIVIYGELTNEFKYQEIKVSRSSPYFDNEPNVGISNAKVTIRSSNNNIYQLEENDSIQGLYHSEHKFGAQTGVSYSLSVEVDFNNDGVTDKYEASTYISPAITPDSLTLEPIELAGNKNYLLYMHFQALPEESYYLFKINHNDSVLTTELSNYLISNDILFRGQYVKGNLYYFNDIANQEKDSEERRRYSAYLQSGDRIEAKIGVISKKYYDFITQCQKEKSGENPMFGGPASNIITNISNGGAGYFTGYHTERANIVFKGEP